MRIRLEKPASPSEHDDWVRIMERVSGDVFEVEELTYAIESDEEGAWILAYLGDEPVGIGVGRPSSVAGSQYSMARVLPEHRRQGVGTAILLELSERARQSGHTSLWGRIREDDSESRRFAERRGFEEVGREYEVVLDLAAVETSPEPPPGVEIVSVAERPDLIQPVFELDREVAPDVPRVPGQNHEPWTFERWTAYYLEGPGAVPQALVVAVVDGEVVGYAGMRRRGSTSPTGQNLLTAVRRPWRKRGIATALKLAQIERARLAGIERLFTTNDETNVGMREVNKRLGYRPAPVELLVSGPLVT
jgi:GNAT superfamily N-acetyltransferase